MQEEDFEREVKVLVVGNGAVGKTSMIKRFCKGVFTDEYKKTIGVDFLEKVIHVDSLGEDVRLMLWDTAGQEEFDAITRSYYRGAGAAVLAFSTVDRDSFDAIPKWKEKVTKEAGDIAMALVQNKVDLIDQAVVTSEEAEAMAKRLGMKFYRSCVKENLNVSEVFMYLTQLYDKKLREGQLKAQAAAVSIGSFQPAGKSKADGPSAGKAGEKRPQSVNLKENVITRTGGTKSVWSKCSVG
uniref:Ras-related protein Rab-23 n=1 Tax=Tetraselmis sp. GSL018 TaxID=582737 RepID=A0A061R075_9CHLO|mmetsp:Transcript_6106/g.14763  ORF Transcript_6106/g.14763 Transcript_6106/m.14763 type:complete len:240 (-) Transcript_6106:73-792(-)